MRILPACIFGALLMWSPCMLVSIVPRQKRPSWPLASLKVHGDLQLAPFGAARSISVNGGTCLVSTISQDLAHTAALVCTGSRRWWSWFMTPSGSPSAL